MARLTKIEWLCITGIIIYILLCPNISLASAWLLDAKKYKYSFSFSVVSDVARREKQKRADLYLTVHQKIASLEAILNDLTKSSALYNKVYRDIEKLKKIASELESYQDEYISSFSAEYGINDYSSFGVNALYNNNRFYRSHSHIKSFDVFYKFKLFQNKSYILTIQPKIIINEGRSSPQELFHEVSLAAGLSKEKKSVKFFSESSLAIGLCCSKSCQGKQYYSFALSEGAKLPLGLMLVNFTKYYIRKNYGTIYSNNLYEQVSIAKEINSRNRRQNNLTMQLGYFWDKSLKNANYQTSGTVFSIWLEI